MGQVYCRLREANQPHSLFNRSFLYKIIHLNAPSEIVLSAQMYTSGGQHIQFVQHSTTVTTTTTTTTIEGLASETLLPELSPNVSEKYPQI